MSREKLLGENPCGLDLRGTARHPRVMVQSYIDRPVAHKPSLSSLSSPHKIKNRKNQGKERNRFCKTMLFNGCQYGKNNGGNLIVTWTVHLRPYQITRLDYLKKAMTRTAAENVISICGLVKWCDSVLWQEEERVLIEDLQFLTGYFPRWMSDPRHCCVSWTSHFLLKRTEKRDLIRLSIQNNNRPKKRRDIKNKEVWAQKAQSSRTSCCLDQMAPSRRTFHALFKTQFWRIVLRFQLLWSEPLSPLFLTFISGYLNSKQSDSRSSEDLIWPTTRRLVLQKNQLPAQELTVCERAFHLSDVSNKQYLINPPNVIKCGERV